MKKLINDPEQVVAESVEGFALAHEQVEASFDPIVVYRSQKSQKVGLVSGGGSGHEPLHAGFVGEGMLDAAVPGPVFTSPTPDPILKAAKIADSGKGVVFIVKNYTGDVLNFDTAAELAEFEGIDVRQIIVNDDVAVEDSLYTAGRRGVAGTVLVEKLAGAAAERGDDLDSVVSIAEEAVRNTRSMGVALTSCTVPHVGKPTFTLDEDEVEIGIGIHGEPGSKRIPMADADHITDQLIDPIVEDLQLSSGDRVIALVNGMGGTPSSELYIMFRRLHQRLNLEGISIERSLVGNFVTSLEMQGASITLMRVNDSMLELFDAPCNTPALRKGV
ncbi:dihydroxyacetone kinase subunit DhaK [Corynebacterium pelargi]|uniref:phosphoenolpyruvate--glycerone phosphotransferase n=1 Tax=Corynebacterium pelargi TaxID=1471400 RepID=A0A410WBV7_9CORY|nr:dihydroxyacetone kinase subunit DhaK [Corynebacterium pelargi]QAU53430.1 PTS-dependent dihydroxyacetone kinase, dihydroxyacetone-binding subunit DhaK [Corynebacterium pelargi]GGG82074.1 dihydroxyacetone kinase subunit DhaK [Corynebacterium pelargi]